MKALCTIFIFSAFSFLFGQIKYVPFEEDRMWGIQTIEGKELIPPTFKAAKYFSPSGYIAGYDVKQRKHVLLDKNGNAIPLPESKSKIEDTKFWNERTKEKDGYVILNYRRKFGVIDFKGEVVHEMKYDKIVDYEGTLVGNIGTDYFLLEINGKVVKVEQKGLDVKKFTEGFAPFRAKNKLFGFVNEKGEVVQPKYRSVGYFSNGFAWVRTEDRTIGFIRTDGTFLIEPKYSWVKNFDKQSNRAVVRNGDSFYFLTDKGEEIAVDGATKLGSFSEGLAYAFKDEKYGFVDKNGKWIIAPDYDKVQDFDNGVARVKIEDKWGMINSSGKVLTPPKYERFEEMRDGRAAIRENGKWGYVSSKGEVVIPCEFENYRNFKNGFAAVQSAGKWGIINTKGEFVLQAKFERLFDIAILND